MSVHGVALGVGLPATEPAGNSRLAWKPFAPLPFALVPAATVSLDGKHRHSPVSALWTAMGQAVRMVQLEVLSHRLDIAQYNAVGALQHFAVNVLVVLLHFGFGVSPELTAVTGELQGRVVVSGLVVFAHRLSALGALGSGHVSVAPGFVDGDGGPRMTLEVAALKITRVGLDTFMFIQVKFEIQLVLELFSALCAKSLLQSVHFTFSKFLGFLHHRFFTSMNSFGWL